MTTRKSVSQTPYPRAPPPPQTCAKEATEITRKDLQTHHKDKGKGKKSAEAALPPPHWRTTPLPNKTKSVPGYKAPSMRARTVVFHGAPTKYKPGLVRRWIEGNNNEARILGVRLMLHGGRRVGSWRRHWSITWRKRSTLRTAWACNGAMGRGPMGGSQGMLPWLGLRYVRRFRGGTYCIQQG